MHNGEAYASVFLKPMHNGEAYASVFLKPMPNVEINYLTQFRVVLDIRFSPSMRASFAASSADWPRVDKRKELTSAVMAEGLEQGVSQPRRLRSFAIPCCNQLINFYEKNLRYNPVS
ncbi:unnamed protein product [Rhodiola kirilowii]